MRCGRCPLATPTMRRTPPFPGRILHDPGKRGGCESGAKNAAVNDGANGAVTDEGSGQPRPARSGAPTAPRYPRRYGQARPRQAESGRDSSGGELLGTTHPADTACLSGQPHVGAGLHYHVADLRRRHCHGELLRAPAWWHTDPGSSGRWGTVSRGFVCSDAVSVRGASTTRCRRRS